MTPQSTVTPDKQVFYGDYGVDLSEQQVTEFTVFGERSTGTNYAQNLISRNFSDLQRTSTFPWEKHSYVATPIAKPNALAMVIVREPIRWMQSLYRNPHQVGDWSHDLSFSMFIRHEWSSVFDGWLFPRQKSFQAKGHELMLDRHPLTGDRPENIVELRNWKMQSYGRIPSLYRNWLIVRYEDLCAAPGQFLESLATTYKLIAPSAYLTEIEDVSNLAANSSREKAPYPDVTAQDRAFILGKIDVEQERRFGYLMQ
ncbi:MAG: hypothetical protein AAF636_12360 [Pseudomonadota bacterium]